MVDNVHSYNYWRGIRIFTILRYFIVESFDRITDNILGHDTKTIKIANQLYAFPKESLKWSSVSKSYAIRFEYMWPSFKDIRLVKGYTRGNKREHQRFSLGILDGTTNNNKGNAYKRYLPKKYFKTEKDNSLIGMEGFKFYSKTSDGNIFQWDSLYKKNNQNKYPTTIKCSKGSGFVKTTCSMIFIDNELVYRIRFSYEHLKNWQEIKSKNIEFISKYKK